MSDLARGTFIANYDLEGGDKKPKAFLLNDLKITYNSYQASIRVSVTAHATLEKMSVLGRKKGRRKKREADHKIL